MKSASDPLNLKSYAISFLFYITKLENRTQNSDKSVHEKAKEK